MVVNNEPPKQVHEPSEENVKNDSKENDIDDNGMAPTDQVPIIITPHFLQRLNQKENNAIFQKFLGVVKDLPVNIYLVDVLLELPEFEKFMKELVTKKMVDRM